MLVSGYLSGEEPVWQLLRLRNGRSFHVQTNVTSARVADSVFGLVGVICMGRTINILHIIVVRRVLVLVPDDETDRSPCRFSFVNTGKELYFVVFLAWGCDFGLSRFTAV